ncbi:MAG: heavy metal translocating P-type ATPase, partial [Microbacteriaceae bacterium]|nr:heavy metal translocating P-type ATPase [Microbacteriaceae bacterium]
MSTGHEHHDHSRHHGGQHHEMHEMHDHGAHEGHEGHAAQTRHADHADHGHAGHGDHGDHAGRFRRLFWIMLAIAVPVVGFSMMFADLIGYRLPDAEWVRWVSPVLGTVMFVWGGAPFLTGAVRELRARRPGMMLLIGLAITVAFLASWGSSLRLLDHGLDFWWELALLIVIMLLGHWIEMRSLAATTSALDSLAALLPDEAELVHGDHLMRVAPSALRVGQLVLVRPGGRIPADGRVASGAASMDESMITGESQPVRRGEGDAVVAGTIATDSAIRVEVTAVGEDTALAGIRRLVAEAIDLVVFIAGRGAHRSVDAIARVVGVDPD